MSIGLNKVQIIGRVTKNLEVKEIKTKQGKDKKLVNLNIATNRYWEDKLGKIQQKTDFHSVVLWGKLAEIAGKYLQKGKKVFIEGRLKNKSWEAQDGTKRYKTEIIGEKMIMFDSKDSSGYSDNSLNNITSKTDNIKKSPVKKEEKKFVEDIEDIPF